MYAYLRKLIWGELPKETLPLPDGLKLPENILSEFELVHSETIYDYTVVKSKKRNRRNKRRLLNMQKKKEIADSKIIL